MLVKRGEIYYADLSPVVGSEQGGMRPVLIVQNDVGNKHSPTVIAAAITSQKDKSKLPTHISLNAASCGLAKDSIVLLEQVRTLDKRRLKERMGELDSSSMSHIYSCTLSMCLCKFIRHRATLSVTLRNLSWRRISGVWILTGVRISWHISL